MTLVFDLQCLAVESSSLADIALDIDIRQEIHLNHVHSLTTTGFAAPTLDVETELTHLITTGLGLNGGGEDLPDRIKSAGVRRRVGAGCPADRTLINDDDLVDRLQTTQFTKAIGERHLVPQAVLEGRMQQLIHEGALAAAAHSGN